jgi:hypothetical protein
VPRILLCLALVLAVASGARAQDAEGPDVIGFANARGLTGMRDLLDARTPSREALRLLARGGRDESRVVGPDGRVAFEKDEMEVAAGVAFLGHFEVGLRWKAVEYVSTNGDATTGIGDSGVTGKAGVTLAPVSVAPYFVQGFDTGAGRLDHTWYTETGAAGTLAFLEDRVALHLNLAFLNDDPGQLGFLYRLGVSAVPFAETEVVVRPFAYVEGVEREGTRGCDVSVAVGVQTRLLQYLGVTVDFQQRVATGTPHLVEHGTWSLRATLSLTIPF